MKNFKKRFSKILASTLLLQAFFTSPIIAKPINPSSLIPINLLANANNDTITIQAAEIVWIFTYINGVLHKRQFNQTKGEWIGKWIPA